MNDQETEDQRQFQREQRRLSPPDEPRFRDITEEWQQAEERRFAAQAPEQEILPAVQAAARMARAAQEAVRSALSTDVPTQVAQRMAYRDERPPGYDVPERTRRMIDVYGRDVAASQVLDRLKQDLPRWLELNEGERVLAASQLAWLSRYSPQMAKDALSAAPAAPEVGLDVEQRVAKIVRPPSPLPNLFEKGLEALFTPYPGAGAVRAAAGAVGEAIGRGAAASAAMLGAPGIVLPGGAPQEEGAKAGRTVAEAVAPRTYADLLIEAIPGIGVGPDLARAARDLARSGIPATRAGVQAWLATEEGAAWATRLAPGPAVGETAVLSKREIARQMSEAFPRRLPRPRLTEPELYPGAQLVDRALSRRAARDLAAQPDVLQMVSAESEPVRDAVAMATGNTSYADVPKLGAGRTGLSPDIPNPPAQFLGMSPQERAAMPRSLAKGVYEPLEYSSVDDMIAHSQDLFDRAQRALGKIPGGRAIGSFLEPIAAARAAAERGDPIPMAMVRAELYATRETSRLEVALGVWEARYGRILRLTPEWRARAVRMARPIESPLRQTIRDIIEFPEDYILTSQQAEAIQALRDTINATTEFYLRQGIDIPESIEHYFPRPIIKGPGGKSVPVRDFYKHERTFDSGRSALAAGYRPANPRDSLLHWGMKLADELSTRETFAAIRELGESPASRVSVETMRAMQEAKEAYAELRRLYQEVGDSPEMRDSLIAARNRLATVAKRFAREARPRYGERRFGGLIYNADVIDELEKYAGTEPRLDENLFQLVRATRVTGDFSHFGVQGAFLRYGNPTGWLRAIAYGVVATVRNPYGYLLRNLDVIEDGLAVGAIMRLAEFLVPPKGSGYFSELLATLPVVRHLNAPWQRSFSWFTFVGQVEMWKALRQLARTDIDKAELAAINRKMLGVVINAGQRRSTRGYWSLLAFAPRFLIAVHSLPIDGLRGGLRGAVARRVLAQWIAGATALTIAGQIAADGTFPNLTDPLNKKKRWLYIETKAGGINVYGPLYPFLKAAAAGIEHLSGGDWRGARNDALFFGRGKASIPLAAIADLLTGETIIGEPLERGIIEFAKKFGLESLPIGPHQALQEGIGGIKRFPYRLLEMVGERTTPDSPSRIVSKLRDQYAQKYFGQNWDELTPRQEQQILDNQPDLVRAVEERDASYYGDMGRYVSSLRTVRDTADKAVNDRLQPVLSFLANTRTAADYTEQMSRLRQFIHDTRHDESVAIRTLDTTLGPERDDSPEGLALSRWFSLYSQYRGNPQALLEAQARFWEDPDNAKYRDYIKQKTDLPARTLFEERLRQAENYLRAAYFGRYPLGGTADEQRTARRARELARRRDPYLDAVGYVFGFWGSVLTNEAAQRAWQMQEEILGRRSVVKLGN